MKPRSILLISLLLSSTAVPDTLFAAVAGSLHEVTRDSVHYGKWGVCSACHIPSRSARTWPRDQWQSGDDGRGEVGALCSYCHDPAAGMLARARTGRPFRNTNPVTHGFEKDNLPSGSAMDEHLPYSTTPSPVMECTTCHNVHDNSSPPFLQDDREKLCLRCHQDGPPYGSVHGEEPPSAAPPARKKGKTALSAPAPPRELKARFYTDVNISWTADRVEGSFVVYRAGDGGGDWARIAFITSTSYTDKYAEYGKIYWYAVSAVNDDGVESERSTPLKVIMIPRLSSLFCIPREGSIEITLSSNRNLPPGFVFNVYRAPFGGGQPVLWAKSIKNEGRPIITDSTVKDGEEYLYTVALADPATGVEGPRNTCSGVMGKVDPMKPVSVRTSLSSPGEPPITIGRNRGIEKKKYLIYRAEGSGDPGEPLYTHYYEADMFGKNGGKEEKPRWHSMSLLGADGVESGRTPPVSGISALRPPESFRADLIPRNKVAVLRWVPAAWGRGGGWKRTLIYRAEDRRGPYELIATVEAMTREYLDPVFEGREYWYLVAGVEAESGEAIRMAPSR